MPPISSPAQWPYAARLAFVLISITILVYWMSVLAGIITPLLFSIIFAIALHPLAAYLERKKCSRLLATSITIVLFSVVSVGVIWLLAYQVTDFSAMLPQLVKKANQYFSNLQQWADARFHIPPNRQIKEVQKYAESLANSGGAVVGTALSSTTNILSNLVLMPLYMFFLLYYRTMFKQFFHEVFSQVRKVKVDAVVQKIYDVVHNYLSGLVIVTLIVGTLNSIGLLALGIPSAIFFGFLAAFLLIIPFIGIMIGSILPIIVALVTKDSSMYAVGVAGLFFFIQLLEGNFITPYIVGSKISVNPLAAMLGLLLGSALWGIAGMALALPITAILKVVFDAVEGLKPYGLLLGEPQVVQERSAKSRKVRELEKEVVDTITETTNEVKSFFRKKRTAS